VALALLDDAYGGHPPLSEIPLFANIDRQSIAAVRRMIARNFNAPLARGVGRYFDAFGSFILGLPEARYEGEIAFRWNVAADPAEDGLYPMVIHDGESPWEIDPRKMVRAAVNDLLAGKPAAEISARFHNTIAAATVEIARAALDGRGDVPVVLSGGCFQNARLAESIIHGLARMHASMNRDVRPATAASRWARPLSRMRN
jgi:hydrogenase maturation protein HypF